MFLEPRIYSAARLTNVLHLPAPTWDLVDVFNPTGSLALMSMSRIFCGGLWMACTYIESLKNSLQFPRH